MITQKPLLNPYLNPFESGTDEVDDVLFINDRQRIYDEIEKPES